MDSRISSYTDIIKYEKQVRKGCGYYESNFDCTHKLTDAHMGKDAQGASTRWFTEEVLDDWTTGVFQLKKKKPF